MAARALGAGSEQAAVAMADAAQTAGLACATFAAAVAEVVTREAGPPALSAARPEAGAAQEPTTAVTVSVLSGLVGAPPGDWQS